MHTVFCCARVNVRCAFASTHINVRCACAYTHTNDTRTHELELVDAQESYSKSMTLAEAEVLALATLKQVNLGDC